MSEAYAGQQIVGVDLHRRRSVIVRMTKSAWPGRAAHRRAGRVNSALRLIEAMDFRDNPSRAAYGVALFLQRHGKRIVPVHPSAVTVHGEHGYPSLAGIPFPGRLR